MAKKKAEGGMKKVDAVREALKEGLEKPIDAVAFIKEKFNIEMTPQTFSTTKSQLKAKEAAGGKAPKAKATTAKVAGHDSMGGSPAELARSVKGLVEKFGAGAVQEMASVFEE